MSLICSWMRRGRPRCRAVIVALCWPLLSNAAEAESARLGVHFYDTPERRYQALHSMSDIQDHLKVDMQRFVTGFDDCPAIVAGPIEKGRPRDRLRDTWTVIQSVRVACWAALQLDPATAVTATGPDDRITPDMIRGIMLNSERLSAGDQEWAKALTTFDGGSISCKDRARCTLAAPDDGEWAKESVLFDLVLVDGDDRFIEVTQQYEGRAGFVYGVRWRITAGGGEVTAVFPELK